MGKKRNINLNHSEEVDEYISKFSDGVRNLLESVRRIILDFNPEITERVSWGFPIFRLKNDLVAVASHKNHCSFYTMSPDLMQELEEDLKEYKVSGTSIHFDTKNPVKESIIIKIIQKRIEEVNKIR